MKLSEAISAIKGRAMPDQIRTVCLDILTWMEGSRPEHLQLLTPMDLSKALTTRVDEVEFFAAVSLLASSDFAVLEMGGYIEDPEAGEIILDGDDLARVLMDDSLVHPETGEEVEHPQEHVHLFYSVRDGSFG